MSISSVGHTAAAMRVERVTSATTSSQARETTVGGGADSVKVSKRGAMLARLKDLASSDPAKFKEVTKEISDKLTAAAADATGEEKQALTSLADRFSKASDSGDMSSLAPPAGQGAGGAQRGHGPRRQPPPPEKADDIVSAALTSASTTAATASTSA
jgi:hypothetical protein